MKAPLTLREWSYLPIHEGGEEGSLLPAEADRLHAVAQSAERDLRLGSGESDKVLQHHKTRIRAQQVVGVLAAPGVAVEILPKIDNQSDEAVRHVLVEMLAQAFNLPIAPGRLAELSRQHRHLLEIIIGLFCELVFRVVHRGLPRAYVGQMADLPSLRGRLDVYRQFGVLAASPQKLACHFDELSSDILPNRILKTAINRLRRQSSAPKNQRQLAELDFMLEDIRPFAPGEPIPFQGLVLDRTNERLRAPLEIARFLIEGSYQTTSSGHGRGFALLFEMNTLFEEFVGRAAQRVSGQHGARVHLQGPRTHVLNRESDGRALFATKPDIYWSHAAADILVDTKWKRLDASDSEGRMGVSQGDIYQMMAYAHVYPARRLILLYPHHAALGKPAGTQARFRISGTDKIVEIATIDVARPDEVPAQFSVLMQGRLDDGEDPRVGTAA
jgi:5-methylcytosine-specific restriction enzyme subunit McrC